MQTIAKYPEELVRPMREELSNFGVEELKTAAEVDAAINHKERTTLVVINSVCGCAAGNARPGVKLALQHKILPDRITTVFAGVDQEAVAQTRKYILGYPPSSPSIALFKNGQLQYMMPRHRIEGRKPQEIAQDLIQAFNLYCV